MREFWHRANSFGPLRNRDLHFLFFTATSLPRVLDSCGQPTYYSPYSPVVIFTPNDLTYSYLPRHYGLLRQCSDHDSLILTAFVVVSLIYLCFQSSAEPLLKKATSQRSDTLALVSSALLVAKSYCIGCSTGSMRYVVVTLSYMTSNFVSEKLGHICKTAIMSKRILYRIPPMCGRQGLLESASFYFEFL